VFRLFFNASTIVFIITAHCCLQLTLGKFRSIMAPHAQLNILICTITYGIKTFIIQKIIIICKINLLSMEFFLRNNKCSIPFKTYTVERVTLCKNYIIYYSEQPLSVNTFIQHHDFIEIKFSLDIMQRNLAELDGFPFFFSMNPFRGIRERVLIYIYAYTGCKRKT